MDEKEEKEKKRKREKDVKSKKKPSVLKPGVPEEKDGVLKAGNSPPGFQASGPTCCDGRWMVDGGWWMVEKKVL